MTSGYLYVPRDGNATAGCLQSDGWTLYSSSASGQLGVGFGGTQGLLAHRGEKTTISSGVLHLTPIATPGSPAEGDVYVNSTDHHTYEWNGTAWKRTVDNGENAERPTQNFQCPNHSILFERSTFNVRRSLSCQ